MAELSYGRSLEGDRTERRRSLLAGRGGWNSTCEPGDVRLKSKPAFFHFCRVVARSGGGGGREEKGFPLSERPVCTRHFMFAGESDESSPFCIRKTRRSRESHSWPRPQGPVRTAEPGASQLFSPISKRGPPLHRLPDMHQNHLFTGAEPQSRLGGRKAGRAP